VRHAVAAGVVDPAGWEVVAGTYDDRALASAAEELLAGDAGGYVRSHGGSVELLGVHDGVVAVRLRGACQGCPASEVTLRHHLERQLRERCPSLVALVAR
jgi:Fe-S cluster biogenesis protein NfuA